MTSKINEEVWDSSEIPDDIIDAVAKVTHQVNKAYCEGLGDNTQKDWDEAEEWQKKSARIGVRGVLEGNGPKESHQCWLETKLSDGWAYGPIKDADKKLHPCMVPYEDLPKAQKYKDTIFVSVVIGVVSDILEREESDIAQHIRKLASGKSIQ